MMAEGSDESSDDGGMMGLSPSAMPVHGGGMIMKGNKPWVPAIDDQNYFEDLLPEEIYDSFFSIRRMGFIANRIIRKLNETKHIVSSKILEKRKKLKALQRKQFEQLSPAGVEYLKVLLKMGKPDKPSSLFRPPGRPPLVTSCCNHSFALILSRRHPFSVGSFSVFPFLRPLAFLLLQRSPLSRTMRRWWRLASAPAPT